MADPKNSSFAAQDTHLADDKIAAFVTTHWSVVLHAGRGNSLETDEALEKLCRLYWYPLYAYVRRKGHTAHDAQDLTQKFFARLLEKKYLTFANRSRGKFRSFLLTSLQHFLVMSTNSTGMDLNSLPVIIT